jgi:hypothetical protein
MGCLLERSLTDSEVIKQYQLTSHILYADTSSGEIDGMPKSCLHDFVYVTSVVTVDSSHQDRDLSP